MRGMADERDPKQRQPVSESVRAAQQQDDYPQEDETDRHNLPDQFIGG